MTRRILVSACLALALSLGFGGAVSASAAPPPVVTDPVLTVGILPPPVATDTVDRAGTLPDSPCRLMACPRIPPDVIADLIDVATTGLSTDGTFVGWPGARTYVPAWQYQLISSDPQGGYNCTAYSLAMAVDKATYGGARITGAQVRALGSAQAFTGMTLPQVVAVAAQSHVYIANMSGHSWSDVIAYLAAYRGVILQGDYDQIPAPYSGQLSFKGYHAVYVDHLSSDKLQMYVMDPLFKGGAHWVPVSIMRAFATKLGKAMGTTGVYFAVTRVTVLFK